MADGVAATFDRRLSIVCIVALWSFSREPYFFSKLEAFLLHIQNVIHVLSIRFVSLHSKATRSEWSLDE